MVLSFVPQTSANDTTLVCDGIEKFNSLRVNFSSTSTYDAVNLALFIITSIIFTLSVPMAWKIRKEHGFKKLRPFSLTCLLLFFLLLFNTSAFLSYLSKFCISLQKLQTRIDRQLSSKLSLLVPYFGIFV